MADLKELVLTTSGVNPLKCMRCGKCSGTCPSYDAMEYHPHQFVYMVEKGDIEKLMASKSIYTCLSCFACVERCPRDVEPAKLVEAVRLAVIRQQGQNHLKSEQIPEMLDDDLPQQAIVQCIPEIQQIRRHKNAENRCFCMPLRYEHCGDRRRKNCC